MPLPLSRSSGSSNCGEMCSLSLGNLGGVLWGNWKLWVESWGNKRLWVEGGSNAIVDGSNGETRVSNTESSSVSNVLNLLKFSIGVHIGVSSRNSSVGVANLLLSRVDVSVAVVQVAKLILGVELTSSSVRSSSNDWSSSSIGNSRSSSVGESRESRSLHSLDLNLGRSREGIGIGSMEPSIAIGTS